MKNIDVVRKMSIEELAMWVSSADCKKCIYDGKGSCSSCTEGIQKWLEEECELTTQEVYQEYTNYCYPIGECLDCKYHVLESDRECEFNYFVDNFNVINGKITRKEV